MKMMIEKYNIQNFKLSNVKMPKIRFNPNTVILSDKTIQERKAKLLEKMKEKDLDIVIVYADREHGANFEYLTGFIPRFEEALMLVTRDGEVKLLLGNENLNKVQYSRVKAEAVHIPHFSLPNQPMENEESFKDILNRVSEWKGKRIGVVGWKVFTSKSEQNNQLFDVPYYIVEALKELVDDSSNILSCGEIFIGEKDGIRTVNNADEINYYEYGASLASDCVLKTMNEIEIGKTEIELASSLSAYGQPNNVTTICATGDRFTNAVIYPRNKKVKLGDKFATTVGYKGGLTSRAGYIVSNTEELPAEVSDYLERVAIPYYSAVAAWLENVQIGMKGDEMYQLIGTVLPKDTYNWHLNPGHLIADEEWMSSPIYPGSKTELKSGMLLQIDIIPSVKNYGGASAESGIALADESLREEIAREYPELWKRFEERRKYIKEELNIKLHPEVLPLSDTVGYSRPYLLNKESALVYKPVLKQ